MQQSEEYSLLRAQIIRLNQLALMTFGFITEKKSTQETSFDYLPKNTSEAFPCVVEFGIHPDHSN